MVAKATAAFVVLSGLLGSCTQAFLAPAGSIKVRERGHWTLTTA